MCFSSLFSLYPMLIKFIKNIGAKRVGLWTDIFMFKNIDQNILSYVIEWSGLFYFIFFGKEFSQFS